MAKKVREKMGNKSFFIDSTWLWVESLYHMSKLTKEGPRMNILKLFQTIILFKQDLEVLEGDLRISKSWRCWGLVLSANGLFSMFQVSEP